MICVSIQYLYSTFLTPSYHTYLAEDLRKNIVIEVTEFSTHQKLVKVLRFSKFLVNGKKFSDEITCIVFRKFFCYFFFNFLIEFLPIKVQV